MPKFLEDKLKRQYDADSKIPYTLPVHPKTRK
jgi:hypothetical protein